LDGNQIGDDGVKAIAGGLKNNKSVTTLGISWTGIGDEGAKALTEVFRNNKTISCPDFE